jgi:hypothetical protein
MIGHGRAERLATESVDFELSGPDVTALAEHVAACVRCAAFLRGTREDAARLRHTPRVRAPLRVRATLAAAAYGRDSRPRGRSSLLLVAALLLGLLIGAALVVGGVVRPPRDAIFEWTSVPVGRVASDGDAATRMHAVTWGRAGFVALGSTSDGPAVWVSRDGTTWSRADDLGASPDAVLVDVVPVATGYVALGHANGRTAAWESTDGFSWVSVDMSLVLGTGRAIAARAGDLVIVGSHTAEVGGGAAWIRPSGGVWRDATLPAPVDEGFDFTRVASTSLGFLALGPALASSSDGETWAIESVPLSGSAVGADIAEGDGRLVIVGEDRGRPLVWVGRRPVDLEPVDVASARGSMVAVVYVRGRFVAVGNGPDGGLAWASTDGRVWRRASRVERGASSRMVDVATDGERLIAVGAWGTEAAVWSHEETR